MIVHPSVNRIGSSPIRMPHEAATGATFLNPSITSFRASRGLYPSPGPVSSTKTVGREGSETLDVLAHGLAPGVKVRRTSEVGSR